MSLYGQTNLRHGQKSSIFCVEILSEQLMKGVSKMSHNAKRLQRKGFSQTRKKFAPGCTGKTRFRTYEHAKEAIERIRYISIKESLDGTAKRIPVRSYQCTNCKGFHLSSRHEVSIAA